jgi:hypothetical protein
MMIGHVYASQKNVALHPHWLCCHYPIKQKIIRHMKVEATNVLWRVQEDAVQELIKRQSSLKPQRKGYPK